MRRLAFTLLLLWVSPSWGAIVFDAATTMEGTTSTTGNATVAADADVVLVCLAERDTDSSGITADTASVTVGGAAATQLVGNCNSSCGALAVRATLFYKLAPSTGTVTVNATANTGADRLVTSVLSYKGVAQTSTFNTSGTNSNTGSTNMDIDALASAVGEMGILCGASQTSAATASPDATAPVSTERVDTAHTNATSVRNETYEEDGASVSIDMRVDLSSSVKWAAVGVSMRPLASAAIRKREAIWLP